MLLSLRDGEAAIAAVSRNAVALRATVQRQCQLLAQVANEEWGRGSAEHKYNAALKCDLGAVEG